MKAIVLSKFGPPEVLQIRDVPDPVAGEGMVVVRVKTIGLNFADVMARLGVYPSIPRPPFIPGIEFAGVVDALGQGVKGWKRGDRVFGFSHQNAYAERVAVPQGFLARMPPRCSFREAAALGVTSLSAYHALRTLAHIQKGERVLIHAAAGGVGTMAVQMARHWGAEVFATASTPAKLDLARKLGAHHVINYATEDFAKVVHRDTQGAGVDVVLDSVGGSVMRKGLTLLAPMGRYVVFGFAAVTGERTIPRWRALKELALAPLIYTPNLTSRNISVMGFNLYFLTHKTSYLRSAFADILRLYTAKVIRPVIGEEFSFDRIVDAHTALQSRRTVGKVIVHVESVERRTTVVGNR